MAICAVGGLTHSIPPDRMSSTRFFVHGFHDQDPYHPGSIAGSQGYGSGFGFGSIPVFSNSTYFDDISGWEVAHPVKIEAANTQRQKNQNGFMIRLVRQGDNWSIGSSFIAKLGNQKCNAAIQQRLFFAGRGAGAKGLPNPPAGTTRTGQKPGGCAIFSRSIA